MKFKVKFHARAERSIQLLADEYKGMAEELGDDFLKEIAHCVQTWETFPKGFPLYYKSYRRMLLGKFPYKFFYKIIDKEVIIYYLAHAHADHEQKLR